MERNWHTQRILVFGKDGQVGKAFQEQLRGLPQVFFLGRQECDLTKSEQILSTIEHVQPSMILNAAAYTAVDRAQIEPELAYLVNEKAPQIMADYIARVANGVLVHYSTDYVFDGCKQFPYLESDLPNPLGEYGNSKRAGEIAIQRAFDRSHFDAKYFILRTSWVYGDGKNFIQTMLLLAQEKDQLQVISDQYGVPSSADWLASIAMKLIAQDVISGIYHVVPEGQTSWHGLACFALQVACDFGANLKISPQNIDAIPATAYPLPSPRPYNSRLSNQKLKEALQVGILPDWHNQVLEYVKKIISSPIE